MILPSPFAKERRPIVVATDVTTFTEKEGERIHKKSEITYAL